MPTHNNCASFTHTCIKVPIDPYSGFPCPLFERKNETLLKMKSRRDTNVRGFGPVINHSPASQTKLGNDLLMQSKCSDPGRPLKSYIEFYESIPDYGDMNHLSDEEFYRKLQNLKEKQKQYSTSLSCLFTDEYLKDDVQPEVSSKVSSAASNVCSDLRSGVIGVNCTLDNRLKGNSTNSFKARNQFISSLDCKTLSSGRFKSTKSSKQKKFHRSFEASTSEESTFESSDTAKINKKSEENTGSEHDGFDSKSVTKAEYEKETILAQKPPKKVHKELLNLSRDSSSKSTRKNCPQVRVSSGSLVDSAWDNFSADDFYPKSGHSFSDSDSNIDLACQSFPAPRPSKSVAWREPKITVPVPFPMTLREKENQEIRSLKSDLYGPMQDSSMGERKRFKTRPVPIESRIPLYDKIMNEQENRRMKVKKQSIANLKAKMKPFSFVTKDEEEKRYLMTHSSPELRNVCNPVKLFRAKPVPKNLFSSHVYQRMREDEFYRTLRKRIRSEELLRSSSLPPSMAAREKESTMKEKFPVEEGRKERRCCPRRKRKKIPNYKMSHEIMQMELEGRKNENITTTPHPFHLETAELHDKKARKRSALRNCCNTLCDVYLPKDRDRPASAGPYVLHRNNLASVLRIQSSRERAEQEKMKRKEERRHKEEAKLREREFRKDPAWKLVSGWGGVNEDLALRACTRRQEEEMRRQIHRHQMENMMHRVYRIPTLFERQSQIRLSRKAVKEATEKNSTKEQAKKANQKRRQRKLSVKLLSKEDNTLSPTPRDQAKVDTDESYESDPEDDKTCRQSMGGEDVDEGTGLEDEIKDEEAEREEDDDQGVGNGVKSASHESASTSEEAEDMPTMKENESYQGGNPVLNEENGNQGDC